MPMNIGMTVGLLSVFDKTYQQPTIKFTHAASAPPSHNHPVYS